MNTITEEIQKRLEAALTPEQLSVTDDSEDHVGHAGARSGGHYTVSIVANAFEGLRLTERHRLVYQALGELMQSKIHALRIQAKAPNELSG